MRKLIIDALLKAKTVYVSHLAASIAVTAITGTVAVGGIGYGVYTASRPTPVETVTVAEEVSPVETKESTPAATKPVKTETTTTASSEKVETAKKEEKTAITKKEEKESSKTEEKVTAKTEQKSNATAAETKKESSSTKTETKSSAPAKSETTKTTPAKAEPAKEEAPKAHTHTWAHKDAVTMPQYEMQYVVDQAAWDEPITSTYTVTDYNTEPMIIDGGFCPAGSIVVGSHEVTTTDYMHHDEQGHMERVQVGTTVLEPGYDYCSECGARR